MLILVALLVGCPPNDTDTDPGTDVGTDPGTDLGTDSDSEPDTAGPLAGFGDLSGDCGPLSDEDLGMAGAFYTSIDLPTDFDDDALTDGGQDIVDAGNLNSNSLYSEVFAFEVLHRCEGAVLEETEGSVTYDDPNGKKTDLVVTIDGVRVGVSVVRAVGFPRGNYSVEQAGDILADKLADVPDAAANASEADAWDASILHVIAYDETHMDHIETALGDLSSEQGNTTVYVTATNGSDGFIYGDDEP